MSSPLRHASWVLSLVFHILVIVGGAYFAAGTHVKINLDRKMYEVSLVGAPNKGKPGAKSALRPSARQADAYKKPPSKAAPEAKPLPEQKKPEKKTTPPDTAKAIPQETVNATKTAKVKEKEKTEARKEEPKAAEAKKDAAAQNATAKKTEKTQSKEDILAQALNEASKTAKSTKGKSDGPAKSSKGGSKDALKDALADLGKEVAGRGRQGDGTAEDGDGTGESSGTIEEWYATQVVRAIRQNWRFPRLSNVVLATRLELRLNRAGEILSYRQLSGSGRADFDSSVQRAVEDTKRLPRVPESVGTTIVITFYNTDNE